MSRLIIRFDLETGAFRLRLLSSDSLRTSKTWEFYGVLEAENPDEVVDEELREVRFCKICFEAQQFLRFVKRYSKCSSTNTLALHLLNKHGIRVNHQSLDSIITNHPRSKVYLDLTLKIILDNDSFNSMNSQGYQLLARYFGLERMPTGTHLSNHVLPLVYEHTSQTIFDLLNQEFRSGFLCIDMWSESNFRYDYIAFNLFWMDTQLDLHKTLLDISPFTRPHTAARIIEQINDQLSTYNLNSNQIFFMIDNGANLIAAMNQGGFEYGHCLAHNIHLLIINDALGNCRLNGNRLQLLLSKLKKMYNYFKYRKQFLEDLRHEVVAQLMEINYDDMTLDERYPAVHIIHTLSPDLNRDELINELEHFVCIRNHLPSRWGTLRSSLKSVDANFNLINAACWSLGDEASQFSITSSELSIIKGLVANLDMLDQYTRELGSETKPVIHDCLLAKARLKLFFASSSDRSYPDEVVEFRRLVRRNLDSRFELNDYHKIGALLDPAIKNSRLVVRELGSMSANEFLMNSINRHLDSSSQNPPNLEANSPPNQPEPSHRMTRSRIRASNSATPSPAAARSSVSVATQQVEPPAELSDRQMLVRDIEMEAFGSVTNRPVQTLNEIELYFSSGTVGQYPLNFWKNAQNQLAFPTLFSLFRKIGCYQLTNSGTERTFAGAGLKCSKKQARQLDRKLQKLVYVKQNFKYLQRSISSFNHDLLLEANAPNVVEADRTAGQPVNDREEPMDFT